MIYLVDASVFIFRAYFAVPSHIESSQGEPVNAVYGFTQFLVDFLKQTQAEGVAITFDESLNTSFRNDIYPAYKANRDEPPDELLRQFEYCQNLCDAAGLFRWSSESYEADDLIGTLVRLCCEENRPCTIVSRDKDLTQLVGPAVDYLDFTKGVTLDAAGVEEAMGVPPERIADWLALMGDSVDNIPGVPGIGRKTATALLQHFSSLNDVYAHLADVEALPIRGAGRVAARLAEHEQAARLALELTTINCSVPHSLSVADLDRRPGHAQTLSSLFDQLDFGQRLRREVAELTDAK